jgi:hypothetical protein
MTVVAGVWRPTERQEDLLLCPANEILFGGGAGGGKSEGLIGDFLSWHTRWGRTAHGLILRKTYKELLDIVAKSRKIIGQAFGQNCFSKSDFMWNLPTGGTLRLGYLDEFDDWLNYQGHEFTWMGWDELTQWENDKAYLQMFSRLRGVLPDMSSHPTRTVCTSNPGSAGHLWVKDRFINIGPANRLHEVKFEAETWDGLKTYTRVRAFLPALVWDNPYLRNSEYVGNLAMLNPTQRDMLLYGNWDVIDGQFFHEWDRNIHVIPWFNPPREWPRFMGADWGTSDPYCFLWGAKAPNGDKYIYRELYGECNHETASSVAEKILSIEREAGEVVVERYLDSSCWNKLGFETPIAEQFAPIHFEPSYRANKAAGLNVLREHLKIVNKQSRLKIMSNCVNLTRTLPALTVDLLKPDQYNEKQENHAVDALTYMLRGSLPADIEAGMAKYLAGHHDMMRGNSMYGAH